MITDGLRAHYIRPAVSREPRSTSKSHYVLAGTTPVLVHNCGGSESTNGRQHSTKCECASGGTPRIPRNLYGRKGNPATRDQLDLLRDDILEANPDWKHAAGGSLPERATNLPNGSVRYPDLTFEHPETGAVFHVQTVDTYASGAADPRELENALDIAHHGGGPVVMYPKSR